MYFSCPSVPQQDGFKSGDEAYYRYFKPNQSQTMFNTTPIELVSDTRDGEGR